MYLYIPGIYVRVRIVTLYLLQFGVQAHSLAAATQSSPRLEHIKFFPNASLSQLMSSIERLHSNLKKSPGLFRHAGVREINCCV
ncbi:hypothetical protein L209DRAFT_755706 [Thermothelomyces heterothallicus CBS 203.75]